MSDLTNNISNTFKLMFKALIKPDNKLSLIPNWLSFSRTIIGFIIPIMAYSGASLIMVGSMLFLAEISDFLDGKIARMVVKEETKDGAMLDAVSDKIFSFLLMLSIIPTVPIFSLNVILEIAISVINGKMLAEGKIPKSNMLGKIKTWPLFIALGLSYMGLTISNPILFIVASGFSLGASCLECVNVKQYLDTYSKDEICDLVLDEASNNLSEEKDTLSYKFCKDNEISEITFDDLPKKDNCSKNKTLVKRRLH